MSKPTTATVGALIEHLKTFPPDMLIYWEHTCDTNGEDTPLPSLYDIKVSDISVHDYPGFFCRDRNPAVVIRDGW